MTAIKKPENKSGAAPPRPLVVAVDDDPSTLRVMRILLEGNGFEVRTASNGEEALQMLRQIVPTVMILDVELPGMSGLDLCQIIKRNQRLARVPVIFLTGHGTPQEYATGHAAGAVAYVVKPYKGERLVQLVRMLAASTPAA
jgi:two-component system sensor histidine kinase ChiS